MVLYHFKDVKKMGSHLEGAFILPLANIGQFEHPSK